MKKSLYLVSVLIIFSLLLIKCSDDPAESPQQPETVSSTVFNGVLFYDGYAETVSEPFPQGVVRVQNSRYAAKISSDFISRLKPALDMEVIVEAACDNYDRIGSVFISMISKDQPYQTSAIEQRIEIARFITPFMDKNKSPQEVPYKFNIDNISRLLRDPAYNKKYDFWMELDIFGVPYAANKQIEGCAGKNYTFFGTVNLTSRDTTEEYENQSLLPVATYVYVNNYKDTDVMGKTIRSFNVETPVPVKNARLYVITSNHGSNQGGEEYNRRDHYIYFDEQLVNVYKPGGKSCEPFRVYNTQSNGIYGSKPRTDAEWSSFSNWCPGDVIPTRVFDLGDLNAGTHTFKIEVPDAKFVNKQGEIPLSVYVQGDI